MITFGRVSNYDINIRHTVNGGCIGKIGCAELSFSSPTDMLEVMKEYYEDPEKMEKQYNVSIGQDIEGPYEDEGSDRPQVAETAEGPNRALREGEETRQESRLRGSRAGAERETGFNNDDVNFD